MHSLGILPESIGNFLYLQQLILRSNKLHSSIPPTITHLSSLIELDISINILNGSLPDTINQLSNLQQLLAFGNKLSGIIPNGIVSLTNLQDIELFNNLLHGSIPINIGQLVNLEVLLLSTNLLTNSIPSSIGSLSRLYYFSLNENALIGSIPRSLCSLTSMQYLYLYSNNLNGSLPDCIGSLNILANLYIHNNDLTGSIPSNITLLTVLRYCYLYSNAFAGTLPTNLGNLHNLVNFQIQNNQLHGDIPESLSNCSMLQVFRAENNPFHCSIPNSFGNLKALTTLSLYNTQLIGKIPDSLGQLTLLTTLSLQQNKLVGCIPASLAALTALQSLTLQQNQLTGTLPDTIGNFISLTSLQLYSNRLNGTLPVSLGNLINLQILFLQSNRFVGTIPASFMNLQKLTNIALYFNLLTGTIASTMINSWVNLISIRVQNNFFHGRFPVGLLNLRKLQTIDLSKNEFTGTVPFPNNTNWQTVKYFSLQYNFFNGTISNAIKYCKVLQTVYLSHNRFTGSIPNTFTTLTALAIWYANDNAFSKTLPSAMNKLTSLQIFSMYDNFLTGTLPDSFGGCKKLRNLILYQNFFHGTLSAALFATPNSPLTSLFLYQNMFTGSIPSSIGNLTSLQLLSLHDNFFEGTIPSALSHCKQLRYFYLYDNVFSGSLPPALFQGMYSLQTVIFENNHFTGQLPDFAEHGILLTINFNKNFFTGSLPSSLFSGMISQGNVSLLNSNWFSGTVPSCVCNISRLVQFDVTNNALTGTFPTPCTSASYGQLQLLQLSNNAFTGSLPLFSLPLPSNLSIVYVDNNRFSGTIPSRWFDNVAQSGLSNLVMSVNCLSGTIPRALCQHTHLQQVILDGMSSGAHCSSVSLFGSELLMNGVGGSIPDCLFSLPVLTQLQLSGNMLTNTIPTVTLSPSLQTLIVASNILTGTIPFSLWNALSSSNLSYIDLSFNRFRDELSSFLVHTDKKVFTFYSQVNRLSGTIPSSYTELQAVNILEGNLFQCDAHRHDLPSHDPIAASYSCGSDDVNEGCFSWIGLIVSVLIGVGILYGRFYNPWMQVLITYFTDWYSWYKKIICERNMTPFVINKGGRTSHDVEQSNVLTLPNIIYLTDVDKICSQITFTIATYWCGSIGMFILIPVFSALSTSFSTYTHSYTWIISAAYLHGLLPACILLIIFYILVFGIVILCSPDNTLLLIKMIQQCCKVINQEKPYETSSSTFLTTPVETIPPATTNPLSFLFYAQFALVFCLNCIIVGAVNYGYLLAVINQSYDTLTMTLIEIALSLFKYVWNDTLFGGFFHQMITRRLLSTEIPWELCILMVMMNTILLPYLIQACISPNCFYYLLHSPPLINSTYENIRCVNTIACTDSDCYTYDTTCSTVGSSTIAYIPPFHYSSQCSSSLLSALIPVYLYRYIISGIIQPLWIWFLKLTYDWCNKHTDDQTTGWRKTCIRYIGRCIPALWRIEAIPSEDLTLSNKPDNIIIPQQYEVILMQLKERLVIKGNISRRLGIAMITNLSILLCFGCLFPPLIILILFSMIKDLWMFRFALGRWCQLILESQGPTTATTMMQQKTWEIVLLFDTTFASFVKDMQFGIGLTLLVCCSFWLFTLFDILSNDVGVGNSYWIVLIMGLFPILLMGIHRLARWMMRKQQMSHRQQQDMKKKVVEIELMATMQNQSTQVEELITTTVNPIISHQ